MTPSRYTDHQSTHCQADFCFFNIKNETKDYYIVDKTSDLLMNLKDVASF